MAEYYVHKDVGSDGNPGTGPDNAFATLDFGLRALTAGDTLNIRTGVYTETITLNDATANDGTELAPITVKPYLAEESMISATGAYFSIETKAWWIFDGVTWQNSKAIRLGSIVEGACQDYVSDITFQNCTFQHGSSHGILIQCGSRIQVIDCVFDNIRSRIDRVDAHGILTKIGSDIDDLRIERNDFSDMGADGVQFEGAARNTVIANNRMWINHPYEYRDTNGDVVPASARPFDSVGENAIDIKETGGTLRITGNIMHGFRPVLDVQDASGATGAALVLHQTASNVTVEQNTFYDNLRHISLVNGIDSPNTPSRDYDIKNNSFGELWEVELPYLNTTTPTAVDMTDISDVRINNNTFFTFVLTGKQLVSIQNCNGVDILNNVFEHGEARISDTGGTSVINSDYNSWWELETARDSRFVGANDVETDPLVDWNTLIPLSDSPLIGAGVVIADVTDDFYSVPVGAARDIGAAINGIYIDNVDGDNDIDLNQTDIEINCINAGFTQGTVTYGGINQPDITWPEVSAGASALTIGSLDHSGLATGTHPMVVTRPEAFGNDLVIEFNIATDLETISIPFGSAGGANAVIAWGDGAETEAPGIGSYSHEYAVSGIYLVRISGTFGWLQFNTAPDVLKILRVLNFGTHYCRSFNQMFFGGANITSVVFGYSVAPLVTTLSYAFRGCSGLTDGPDFTGCVFGDTMALPDAFNEMSGAVTPPKNLEALKGSLITTLKRAFRNWTSMGEFYIPLQLFDVSSCTSFEGMLQNSQLTTACYDLVLLAWAEQTLLPQSVAMHFGNSTYTGGGEVAAARATIETMIGQVIIDGGTA